MNTFQGWHIHISGKALYILTSIDLCFIYLNICKGVVFKNKPLSNFGWSLLGKSPNLILIYTLRKLWDLEYLEALVWTGRSELQSNIYVQFLLFRKNPLIARTPHKDLRLIFFPPTFFRCSFLQLHKNHCRNTSLDCPSQFSTQCLCLHVCNQI